MWKKEEEKNIGKLRDENYKIPGCWLYIIARYFTHILPLTFLERAIKENNWPGQ